MKNKVWMQFTDEQIETISNVLTMQSMLITNLQEHHSAQENKNDRLIELNNIHWQQITDLQNRVNALEGKAPPEQVGMTLTAEQVAVLRDLRDRIRGSNSFPMTIPAEVLEVLEVLDAILD